MFPSFCCLLTLILAPIQGLNLDVSFEKDVLPIFHAHCFDCHGEGNTEGELSLESIASLRQGGHTGNALVSDTLIDSELYLRITSQSEGYRMPKRGDRLSESDINTIADWIQQASGTIQNLNIAAAAPSHSSRSVKVNLPLAEGSGGESQGALTGMQTSQAVMFVVSCTIIAALIAWLLMRYFEKSSNRKGIPSDRTSRIASFAYTMVGALTLLMLISLVWLFYRNSKLQSEVRSLRDELSAVNSVVAPTIVIDKDNLPMPPYPMHPPRLGGQYYRGNDERSKELFNGGFYRTATIDLHLVDSDGNRLKWNDDLPEQTAIEIQIQRAPKATRELFKQRVLDQISIEHYSKSTPGFHEQLKFEVVEEEEKWSAKIPLPDSDQWANEGHSGLVYLMYGTQPGTERHPRPHFAVSYDLRSAGSKISPESSLWMGSMYTLGNRVLVPDEKKILLDRWFDWRPIPIIEGTAASDPKLLGVDEHVGKK